MAKKNNKDKLTYKQMISYMDFMNAKMSSKFQEIDTILSTLGYYLKTYVTMKGDDDKFSKLLKKKEKEVAKSQKDLGSDAETKTVKSKKS